MCVCVCVCVCVEKLEINPTEMKKYNVIREWSCLLNYLPMLNVSVFRPSSGRMSY